VYVQHCGLRYRHSSRRPVPTLLALQIVAAIKEGRRVWDNLRKVRARGCPCWVHMHVCGVF
jgi:uncharacterized protein (DUF983 family)